MLPSADLRIEVVPTPENGFAYPKASTCFYLLKLPEHYKVYEGFEEELLAAIKSIHIEPGYGLS